MRPKGSATYVHMSNTGSAMSHKGSAMSHNGSATYAPQGFGYELQ